MLDYCKLMTPYINCKGENMIIYAYRHNKSYKLSDCSSTIRNLMDLFSIDKSMSHKIYDICWNHDAHIKKNEIVMLIDEDEFYIKLNEYCCMLLEIEEAFRNKESAYSQ